MNDNKNADIDSRILDLCTNISIEKNNDNKTIYKNAARYLYEKKLLKLKNTDLNDFEKEVIRTCKNMNKDISDVIKLIKDERWDTYEDFEYETERSRSVLNKLVIGKTKAVKKNTLLTICVAAKLPLCVIDVVLEKAGYSLSRYIKKDMFCRKILLYIKGISLFEFDALLYFKNFETITYKKEILKNFFK